MRTHAPPCARRARGILGLAGWLIAQVVMLAAPAWSVTTTYTDPAVFAGQAQTQVCEAPVPLTQLAQADRDCTPREQCCNCSKGKACGNSCIRADYTCRKGRGCACDSYEVCR